MGKPFNGLDLNVRSNLSSISGGIVFFSADPLSNMTVTFDTKEEAIAFAVEHGKYFANSACFMFCK